MKRLKPSNATDTQLLAHFEQGRDQSAFAEIVRRYGPMVFATAMRRLHCTEDAEEAFQATFLALARAADRLRSGEVLVAWLHNTARRTSSSMRRGLVRRNRLIGRLMDQSDARDFEIDTKNTPPAEAIANDEALKVLDEEISKLPTNLQSAIVLCHLEGLNQQQVAKRLGIPTSTVNDRIAKGRHVLKMKLIQRGITLTVAGLSTYIASSSDTSAAISSSLVADTTAKAALYAAGRSASEIGVSHTVFNEANKVISTMTTTKIATVFLTALAILALAGPIAAVVGMNGFATVNADTFFLDTFDDMNISDDAPFSWSGVTGTVLDASSGDLVVSANVGGAFGVIENLTYDDVSVRSLVRVTGDSFSSVGVGVRGTPGVSSIFGAVSGADSTFPAPNSLVIWKSGEVLQQVPTTLDPTKMDVWIQLDSVGDELTLSAWADGIAKSSVSAQDSELTGNVVGIYFAGESPTSATFKSFETLPEPTNTSMTVLGLLGAAVCFRRSGRRAVLKNLRLI